MSQIKLNLEQSWWEMETYNHVIIKRVAKNSERMAKAKEILEASQRVLCSHQLKK